MSATFIAVALGAVIAAAGTGVLTARCVRAPRLFVGLWAGTLFALTVGLGAQVLGYLSGYSLVAFRAMELGAQVFALLGLSLVLVEVLGKSVPARFAMRLAVAAIGIVAIVVLGSDPLNPNVTFSTTWPNPALFYEPVPRLLIEFVLAPLAGITAVAALLVAGYRIGRGRDDRSAAWPAVGGAVAALALALPGLALLASSNAGLATPLSARGLFTLSGVAAAALGAAAGVAAERLRESIPAGIAGPEHDATGRQHAAERAGAVPDISQWVGQAGYGTPAAWPGEAGYPGEPGYGSAEQAPALAYDMDADLRYPGLAALVAEDGAVAATGRAVAAGRRLGPDGYATEPGFVAGPGYGAEPGYATAAGADPAPDVGPDGRGGEDWDDEADAGRHRPGAPDPHARLFGQIVIYSLVEEQAEEFDRLTERLVSAVQANEPDTLVYIAHQVPTAPLQRILYEVYLDRPAFEDHLRQPYVLHYDKQRQLLVSAMNVIELGLQRAKVSPFPTISEILTESGIDLTGVTRSRRGTRRRHARQPGPESQDRSAGHDRGSLAGRAGGVLAPDPGAPGASPDVPGADAGVAAHSVLLLSRPGCHLCEDARAVVEKVAAEFGVPWTERDITVSEQDLRDYGDMIPVVFVDGVQHDFWRVDADRLRHALSG